VVNRERRVGEAFEQQLLVGEHPYHPRGQLTHVTGKKLEAALRISSTQCHMAARAQAADAAPRTSSSMRSPLNQAVAPTTTELNVLGDEIREVDQMLKKVGVNGKGGRRDKAVCWAGGAPWVAVFLACS
jgi:hypothetical protein